MSIGQKIMRILGVDTEKRRLGNEGEATAAGFLKKCGYRILERNYVAGGYEIDIIASKGDTLAFCEVKTRTVREGVDMPRRPAEAVTPQKQRKILRAAACYKGYNPSDKKMRFDVIEVYIKSGACKKDKYEIKHLVGTFDKDTAYTHRLHKAR